MESKEYLAIEEEVQSGVVISPLGYTTPNQAVARLKKAEQQFDNGQWMTGEEFFAKTRNMIVLRKGRIAYSSFLKVVHLSH